MAMSEIIVFDLSECCCPSVISGISFTPSYSPFSPSFIPSYISVTPSVTPTIPLDCCSPPWNAPQTIYITVDSSCLLTGSFPCTWVNSDEQGNPGWEWSGTIGGCPIVIDIEPCGPGCSFVGWFIYFYYGPLGSASEFNGFDQCTNCEEYPSISGSWNVTLPACIAACEGVAVTLDVTP